MSEIILTEAHDICARIVEGIGAIKKEMMMPAVHIPLCLASSVVYIFM